MRNTIFSRTIKTVVVALIIAGLSATKSEADVIDVDTGNMPAELAAIFKEAEQKWEERIQAYSTELPLAIRLQLTSLQITAAVVQIDGEGGILGFAGPDAVLTFEQPSLFGTSLSRTVVLASSMNFDVADINIDTDDGRREFLETSIHEMGHCFGIGTLWAPDNLIGNQNANGTGLTQYTGGVYALPAYRKAIDNPFATFVPLEQRGGPGSALGHWAEVPGLSFLDVNQQDVMLAFASTINPATGEIVTPVKIITEITYGALADLGFAVTGINGQFAAPKGTGSGRWPKTIGQGDNPFAANGFAVAPAGLSFRTVKLRNVYRRGKDSDGDEKANVVTTDSVDPYNLRNLRWTKSSK